MKEILASGQSTQGYYQSYNSVYEEAFGRPMMLHYPYFLEKNESLEQRQINLTNFVLSHIQNWKNKVVLEVGCGNGVQCIYLVENYPISSVSGIDINEENLDIAINLVKEYPKLNFRVDNAHVLETVDDASIDILICIESAFHYPDKQAFLSQIYRVLKPGGSFVIADILNKRKKIFIPMRWWGKRMSLHHWTTQEYIMGFKNAQLKMLKCQDITRAIIKGFRGYWKWIERKNFSKSSRYRMMKLFAVVECEALCMLLKFRRRYFIFAGCVDTQS